MYILDTCRGIRKGSIENKNKSRINNMIIQAHKGNVCKIN